MMTVTTIIIMILYTAAIGEYSLKLAKSAYLSLRFSKEGYQANHKAVEVYHNKVNVAITLHKLVHKN